MGHESTKQTFDAYAKWIPEDDIDAGMTASENYKYNPKLVI